MANTDNGQDRFGDRLENITLAIKQFKKAHYQPYKNYTGGSVHTHATGSGERPQYTDYLLSILEQQHNLLILLDDRLAKLEEDKP